MFTEEIIPYLEKYFETLDNKKVKIIVEYSVKGGKCIRGFIIKHIMETLSNKVEWQPIVAIELIHAASLVIDDLPCMDNDKERRGKPSAFIKFGKHEAILFSFYIISASIKLLSEALQSHPKKLHIIIEKWCELLGKNLVIGQLMDLNCDVTEYFNIDKNKDTNENIIKYKTCSLFSFTFMLGAIYSETNVDLSDFIQMGQSFGMMFQLVDDQKDISEDKPFRNYILKHGKKKALCKYLHERVILTKLLTQYKLLTPSFKKMIALLDNRFIPKNQVKKLKYTN
jgi:geranylgeranyl pyrophosphate synthase